MIKTIIFDLGKVIVPFEVERALKIFESVSDFSSEEIREQYIGVEASDLFHKGKISADELFDLFKKDLNLRMTFNEFVNAWNSIFFLEPILSEKLFQKLSQNYRLLILSDTNELHFEFIKPKFPHLNYFDDFVLSHEVGALKPSPKMYKAAIEKANCLAEECFFTDDKLENIEGAKEFGIDAVQFISVEQFKSELITRGLLN